MPSGRLARSEPGSAGKPTLPANLQHPGPRWGRRRRRRPPRRVTSACAQPGIGVVNARTHPLPSCRPERPQDARSGSPPDSVPFLVAHHPPEVSPRQQPYRVTAALAFPPSAAPASTPRCRDEDQGTTPTSRPCSTAESVARPGVATSPRPILPWACVPDRTRSRSESAAGWATRASPKATPTAGSCIWRGNPTRPHGNGTDRPPDDA